MPLQDANPTPSFGGFGLTLHRPGDDVGYSKDEPAASEKSYNDQQDIPGGSYRPETRGVRDGLLEPPSRHTHGQPICD